MEKNSEDIKIDLYRLTKPTTLGRVVPQIQALVEQINKPNIIYEGLYMYFLTTVQQSEYVIPKGVKPTREFTLAAIDGIIVGFAHWKVLNMPEHIATAHMDYIYAWNDFKEEVLSALTARFIAFGRRCKCQFFETDQIDQKGVFISKNMTIIKDERALITAHENKL